MARAWPIRVVIRMRVFGPGGTCGLQRGGRGSIRQSGNARTQLPDGRAHSRSLLKRVRGEAIGIVTRTSTGTRRPVRMLIALQWSLNGRVRGSAFLPVEATSSAPSR